MTQTDRTRHVPLENASGGRRFRDYPHGSMTLEALEHLPARIRAHEELPERLPGTRRLRVVQALNHVSRSEALSRRARARKARRRAVRAARRVNW